MIERLFGSSRQFLLILLLLLFLFVLSQTYFLVFHVLAELFSILVAFSLFVLVWFTRHRLEHHFFLFLGIAYCMVGATDLFHTLTYKGMSLIPGYDANLPTQLWIVARLLQVVSLVIAPVFLTRIFSPVYYLLGFLFVTSILWGLILAGFFPDCFVEGSGLTRFKVWTEYLIIALLGWVVYLLHSRYRNYFSEDVRFFIIISVIMYAVSELFFTFYVSVYGVSIVFGHFFKILAFGFLFRAVVVVGLESPFELLFLEIKQREESERAARENLAKAQRIASLGNWTWNIEEDLLQWSDEIFRIFGMTPQQMPPSYGAFLNRVHPDDRHKVEEAVNRSLVDPAVPYVVEHRVVRADDGTVIIVRELADIVRRADGSPVTMMGTVQDITAFKQMEEALVQARERAESASQAKSAFLAAMSHEIRTPMNVVLGMAEMLLESDLNDQQRRFVQTMHYSGRALLGVINDVLDFSRIEAGRFSLADEPFAPRQVVEETIRLMRMAAEEKGLTMESSVAMDIPEAIIGDDTRVRQILINLVGNAIKFTSQGRVEVHADWSREESGMLLFRVADTGIGMSMEQVWDSFSSSSVRQNRELPVVMVVRDWVWLFHVVWSR
ncbi:MAG: PAS domain-containing protein [Magnetococcales bacterium]|nr:PAS domain-containing protein [Magnetococcales bacterium]NGZ07301.1 PAS domain-containing protein [Magnetococcales bacterium]